jgi:ribosomal protein L34E
MNKTCETPECAAEFETKRDDIHLCPACRRSLYYWKKKRPAQVLFRRGRLKVFAARLGDWFDGQGRKL